MSDAPDVFTLTKKDREVMIAALADHIKSLGIRIDTLRRITHNGISFTASPADELLTELHNTRAYALGLRDRLVRSL